jgi:hypothetical protein
MVVIKLLKCICPYHTFIYLKIFDRESCVNEQGDTIWPKLPLNELITKHASSAIFPGLVLMFFGSLTTCFMTVPYAAGAAMFVHMFIEK